MLTVQPKSERWAQVPAEAWREQQEEESPEQEAVSRALEAV